MPPFQHLGPFGSSRPTLVTALHSQVRQEAEYIQERIAAAEGLYRKLTAEITKAQAKLGEARKIEGSQELAKSLKRSIRKKRSRLNRCIKNRQVFEARLASIFADMERMEQRQWRHSSPDLHNLGPSLTRETACTAPSWAVPYMPPSMATGTVQTLSVPTLQMPNPQFPQSLHPISVHIPQTPVIRPTPFSQAGSTPGISPLDTVPYELISPAGFPVTYIPTPQHINMVDAMNHMHISQPHEFYVQASTTAVEQSNLDLSQRPSMLDHQSAAFRLERVARKHRAQRSF